MKHALLVLLFISAALHLTAQITITTDRATASYQAGETATFTITSPQSGQLEWEVRHNIRTEVISFGSFQHNGSSSSVTYTFNGATFINFTAKLNGSQATVGATFSKENITAFTQEPADFDAFWQNRKAELAAIPIDDQLEQIGRNDFSTIYKISLAQIDNRRVYGYLVVPDGDGPFPVSLRMPAFGSGANIATPDNAGADRQNAITMSITIHNAPADQVDPDAYDPNDIRIPESYYYRYGVLAGIRSLDYLVSREDWNQRDIMIYGDSQGGGLSILIAGIDGRPTALMASTSALSQHGGARFNRPSGFPYFLEEANTRYGGNQTAIDQVFSASRYYDAIFAARRFDGPSQHYVNFLDDICPPATTYAAHNALRGPRAMLHSLDLGHRPPLDFILKRGEFFRELFPDSRMPNFIFESEVRGYTIHAGDDFASLTDTAMQLNPSFGYDQLTDDTSDWTAAWSVLSAPNSSSAVAFADATDPQTTVSFADSGRYELRLVVTDPLPEEETKYWTLTDRLIVDVTPRMVDTTTIDTSVSTLQVRELLTELVVAPNPTSAMVTLVGEFASPQLYTIEITDLSGRVVLARNQMGSNLQSATKLLREEFDLSPLAAGVYQLTIRGATGTHTQQIIKQ